MRCPTCRRIVPDEDRRFRPFCSERCKLIDLGRWLDGTYAIPDEEADEDAMSEDEPPRDEKLHKR